MAIRGYTSNDYRFLNSALRSKEPALLLQHEAYIRCVTSGLNQLPHRVGTVFRGANLPQSVVDTYIVRAAKTELHFISTAYANSTSFPGNVQFTIFFKTGKQVDFISLFHHESEILFRPGTKFQILDKKLNAKTNVWEILAKEVEQ